MAIENDGDGLMEAAAAAGQWPLQKTRRLLFSFFFSPWLIRAMTKPGLPFHSISTVR
jgi:hypothetical protein